MINKWQFCAAKLAQSANYAFSAFFLEMHENYARNDELCQNVCQHCLSKPSFIHPFPLFVKWSTTSSLPDQIGNQTITSFLGGNRIEISWNCFRFHFKPEGFEGFPLIQSILTNLKSTKVVSESRDRLSYAKYATFLLSDGRLPEAMLFPLNMPWRSIICSNNCTMSLLL